MEWQPHITVATIVEDQGRFLFVEELKRKAEPLAVVLLLPTDDAPLAERAAGGVQADPDPGTHLHARLERTRGLHQGQAGSRRRSDAARVCPHHESGDGLL